MLDYGRAAVSAALLLAGAFSAAQAQRVDSSGRLPAHAAVERFSPGGETETLFAGAVFSPDGGTAYFTKYSEFSVEAVKTIQFSRLAEGKWSTPRPVSFSGDWSDTTPFVTADGRRIYFASTRPVDAAKKVDFDLWVADRDGEDWGTPRRVGSVNSAANETSPAITADGTLYFCSWREEGGLGQGDLWRAVRTADGGFATPENLGLPINTANGEWGVTVSGDGKLLIFEASGRPEGLSGAGDLYASRAVDGKWSAPVHLKSVSSVSSDLSPRLSPDGERLYFASNRDGILRMWSVRLKAALP